MGYVTLSRVLVDCGFLHPRLRQEEGWSVTKRIEPPFNERHHPDRPDPSQFRRARECGKTLSPAPPPLSLLFGLYAPPTFTVQRYTVPPMEGRHCVLDHGYPDSFLSSVSFFARLPLISGDALLSCVQRFCQEVFQRDNEQRRAI